MFAFGEEVVQWEGCATGSHAITGGKVEATSVVLACTINSAMLNWSNKGVKISIN